MSHVHITLQHAQNWVTSSQPVGTAIKAESGDAPQVSAGTIDFILLNKKHTGPILHSSIKNI